MSWSSALVGIKPRTAEFAVWDSTTKPLNLLCVSVCMAGITIWATSYPSEWENACPGSSVRSISDAGEHSSFNWSSFRDRCELEGLADRLVSVKINRQVTGQLVP